MKSMILFSGLGGVSGSMLQPLRELHARPSHRPLTLAAVDAVQEAFDHVGSTVVSTHLPHGLPLRRWLDGDELVSPRQMHHSVVEGLLIHLYQLCLLQPRPSVTTSPDSGPPSAGIGHSLGVVAGAMAGLRIRSQPEFVSQAHDFLLLVVVGLLRCHQVAGVDRPDPALTRRYIAHCGPGATPSPMATVTGVDVAEILLMLADLGDEAADRVEVGLVNGPRSLVLTGRVTPLLRLWSRHQERWSRDGAHWAFVPTTAPFHSSVLGPALDLVREDRMRLGLALPGRRLTFPIWSMDGSHNLQSATDVFDDCMEQVFCRPVDWSAAVRAAVRDGDVQQVVDYGPGVVVRLHTREMLRSLGLGPSFRRVTSC